MHQSSQQIKNEIEVVPAPGTNCDTDPAREASTKDENG